MPMGGLCPRRLRAPQDDSVILVNPRTSCSDPGTTPTRSRTDQALLGSTKQRHWIYNGTGTLPQRRGLQRPRPRHRPHVRDHLLATIPYRNRYVPHRSARHHHDPPHPYQPQLPAAAPPGRLTDPHGCGNSIVTGVGSNESDHSECNPGRIVDISGCFTA